jgi:MFS family permease
MTDSPLPSAAPAGARPTLTVTQWLIIVIASIGFLFDTYELLMTPLAAPPAIAELLKVPLNHPSVTLWTGRLLWISALCGGVFGLLGGWLTDRLGRKSVMAASIFVYSFSPFAAAYSTSLGSFILFRSTTFIGVCVEFVAAITWLAEVFEDRKQRARWLGITQAFASLGGVLVTVINVWVVSHAKGLPHISLPLPPNAPDPATWRYLLMTGILPAIPIALMLPFVPESLAWKARRASGTLQRPSFGALFSPELRRVTIVTAVLSACAYGIAFGALQLTPLRIAPGLPELSTQSKALVPLRKEAAELNAKFDKTAPGSPERAAVIKELQANRAAQEPFDKRVKEVGNDVQFFQEMGGLLGRIALAVLIIVGIGRIAVLRVFQVPALIVLPVTYLLLFKNGGSTFLWIYGLCGFLTVAQFSYFGEYLPKVFPLHLRGTGGSFATNVGGRMIGTSTALLTTNIVAPMLAGGAAMVKPMHVAQAAGYVAAGIAVVSFLFSFLLPRPQDETPAAAPATADAARPPATAADPALPAA